MGLQKRHPTDFRRKPKVSRFIIFHNPVQLSCLYLQQPQKYQSWRRTRRTTGHTDRDSSRHIPCSVHGLFFRSSANMELASRICVCICAVIHWRSLANSSWIFFQSASLTFTDTFNFVGTFPKTCLEILLTTRNILIINTNWNDKMAKETN